MSIYPTPLLILLLTMTLPMIGGEAAAPAQPPLARNLMTAAEALAPLFNGQPVGIIATRPTIDGDTALTANATYLAKATTAALLRAGIRGLDAEDGHLLTVTYPKGWTAATARAERGFAATLLKLRSRILGGSARGRNDCRSDVL